MSRLQIKQTSDQASKRMNKRKWSIGAMALLGWTTLVILGFWLGGSEAESTLKRQVIEPSNAEVTPVAAVSKPDGGLEKLIGRWVRPDGGYLIEIKKVQDNGRLEAGYYNPNPINVARAEASVEGAVIRIFLELRDVNYPGATYKLTYEAGEDQLKGEYYQPKLGQTFNVRFLRAPGRGPM